MKRLVLLHFLLLLFCIFHCAICQNVSSRPAVVNIGALFTFNSTIGRVSKVAIDAAVDDVNSDPSVLQDTKLVVQVQDTSCNAFIGIMEVLEFMGTDIVAMIGPQSSVIAHVVSLVSSELKVPILSFAATDPTLSSLQYPFFVRTTQSDLFQMQAVAEIVDYFQWRKVIAIYVDDDYGRNGIASLGDKLAERRCQIAYKAAFRSGTNRTEISDLLIKVSQMESRVFVLHASPDSGLTIFSVAHNLNMMGTGFVWIATDWLASLIDSLAPLDFETMGMMQGVLALRQHIPGSRAKDALISRWSKLMKKANGENLHLNAYGLYAYDSVWVFARAMDAFLNDGGKISFYGDPKLRDAEGGNHTLHLDAMSVFDDGDILLSKIRSTNLMGVSGPVQFDSNGYLVHPAYDIMNVIGTGLHTIGFWSNYTGLSIEAPEKIYSKPANHSRGNQHLLNVIWPGQIIQVPRGWVFPNNGQELRIGVPNRASFREFVSVVPNTGAVRGFCIDVFEAAATLLPYAVPHRYIPFGDGHENPNYNDLVRMVASGVYDAVVGDVAITTNRTRTVDFTQPFSESGLVILAAIKKHNSNAWAFLQPFTWEMWCVTGAFFLVVGAVIWVLEHRLNDEFRGSPRKQIVTIFWFIFSTLFFSHRESTVSTLGRVMLIIWLFVVLIIQSSYTASLTSILTVQQLSSPVKGIDSLRSSNDPIGYQVGSFAENYMVEELGIERSRLKPLGSPEAYAQALELGPNNGGVAAVVDERPYVELFLSTECKFTIVGTDFTRSGWGFVFPRDSPLAVDVSTAILTLSETGDLQRIHDKWLTSNACSSQTNELDSERLNLSSFWGLFLVCGLACLLSLLVYFFLMIRQFMHHVPPTTPESSAHGPAKSSRSFHRFLSYIDEKVEDSGSRSKRKSMHKTASENGSQNGNDIES